MTASTRPATAPATYRIDPARSTIRFACKGMFGLATVRGTFTVRHGTIVVAGDVTQSTVTATVNAGSVESGSKRRDADLRSKRFLDTDRHPEITFTSREVTDSTVTGTLTAHGVSQPVTLAVTPEAGGRFVATTRIDRYAFGVTSSKGMVAQYVDLTLEIAAHPL